MPGDCPSRSLDASLAILTRVLHFEASRCAWIPSPPAKPPVLVLWLNQVTRPVLWWTTANPACRLRLWAATLHRLRSTTSSCFSCHHAARTWPRWPPGPSSQAYLSLHFLEAPRGIDLSRPLFTCTNANQAATCTAILGQESVHTTLSITHHSQESPSTGPRTVRSSISPLMSALTTHTSNQFREKRKRNETK
jgi:hypothetical protein